MDNESKVISQINKKISELTVDDIAMYCQENGITIGSLCYKLNSLLNFKKTVKDDMGVPEEVDDGIIQLKALTVALELLKLVGNKDIKVSGIINHKAISTEDIDRLESISRELIGLEKKRISNPIQQGEVIDV